MDEKNNKGLHDGHRSRVRDRFVNEGLEKFYDHQAVELLLFYGVPRKDTNDMAHRLLNRFGSFSAVLDAPLEALQECGISYNAAVLLKLIPAVCARYYHDKYQNGDDQAGETTEKTGDFILTHFIGKNEEQVLLLLFDAKGKRIFCDVVSKGTATASDVNIKKILHLCVQHKASSVVLAHNHPSGIALPSEPDIAMTRKLKKALRSIGILLLDHYIVADMTYCAMSELPDCEDCFY